jgi:hypothetical protein
MVKIASLAMGRLDQPVGRPEEKEMAKVTFHLHLSPLGPREVEG